MTIQTDYEEIEKEIETLTERGLRFTSPHRAIEERKRTFITENLKRINEMILKLNNIWTILVDKTYDHEHIENCWSCNLIDDIRSDLIRLEADKQFLEEKR